jgi:hypothetical protein
MNKKMKDSPQALPKSQQQQNIDLISNQINPFLIDKIFNLQNMYLFPNLYHQNTKFLKDTASNNLLKVKTEKSDSDSPHNINSNQMNPLLLPSSMVPTPSLLNTNPNMIQSVLQNYYNSQLFLNSINNQNNGMNQQLNDNNGNRAFMDVLMKNQNLKQQKMNSNELNTNFHSNINDNNNRLPFSIDQILASNQSLPTSSNKNTNSESIKPISISSKTTTTSGTYSQHKKFLKNLHQTNDSTKNGGNGIYTTNTPIAITAPLPSSIIDNNQFNIKGKTTRQQTGSENQNKPVVAAKSKNAKKYKCDLCGRGFSRSNTLITHRVSLLFFISFI